MLEKLVPKASDTIVGGRPSIDTISTLPPALNALVDRLQKRQIDLEQKLSEVTSGLASLDEECRQRSDLIDDLRQRVDDLDERKADKETVAKLDEEKANKSDLNVKVGREDFDEAIQDMNAHINRILNEMVELESNWKTSLDQTRDSMKNAMSSADMDAFKKSLEARLRTLKNLLETSRTQETTETFGHGDQAAGFRKPLLGYKCVSCDRMTLPVPGDPVASIPLSGHLPHMHTIRPYTTFDLHNIRAQGKYGKTAYDERVWLRMKNQVDHTYRKHVAESLNYAFNAYEQHDTANSGHLPISGGSSIPKGYAIAKAGRSCGGGHTLTNPHVRFTHLKNSIDGSLCEDFRSGHRVHTPLTESRQQEEAAGSEVLDKLEKSHHETEVLGADGHIYKGRYTQQQQQPTK